MKPAAGRNKHTITAKEDMQIIFCTKIKLYIFFLFSFNAKVVIYIISAPQTRTKCKVKL